ncbi:MAG: FAD-binding oxidoreductase [Actinomycetota bacterium]|nr:FAD-binding oxidoreductase [Actinomycetota bacterium]
MAARRRSWWGWGYEGDGFAPAEIDAIGSVLAERMGVRPRARIDPPDPGALDLPAPRIGLPPALAALGSSAPEDRARHAMGCSYADVVRALAGRVEHPPDLVVRPGDEGEVAAVLEWCASNEVAVVPFGGGTSVVGGVEPDVGDGFGAVVSLDLERLSGVHEVDQVSLAARIGAGTLGPRIEDDLRPLGLTLRHFPQSFECSTLGGWVATRAGGHYATGRTHIDDLVESVRAVTPAGTFASRRLPGSGAGPSPDRLLIGSEGALGVVTEAWVRVVRRPRWRAGGTAVFDRWSDGLLAVRDLAQSGLGPANCRLVDAAEAEITGAGDGGHAVLLVGFESADHPLTGDLDRAAEIVAARGGVLGPDWSARDTGSSDPPGGGAGGAGAWRRSFLRAPYLRDALARLGMVTETVETAVTWDRIDQLHDAVTSGVTAELARTGVEAARVTCRITHAYPDGAAPYFTVIGQARAGAELAQWDQVKAVASEAILANGGTITHHHAVGRVHRRWYEQQRPALFGTALEAVKASWDPAGICNPGVLVSRAWRATA